MSLRIAVLSAKRDKLPNHYREDWKGRNTSDDSESVIKALKELGHEVHPCYVDLGVFEKLRENKNKIDLVFNICDDGFGGNPELEPHVPAMLDVLGIPYTGSDYIGLAFCLNKATAKKLLICNGIPTPKFQVFETGDEELGKSLDFPLIVKPLHEDASIGIKDESVVKNEDELMKRVGVILKEYRQPALAEEFIDGREFSVGIIGSREKEALPISEIKFDGMPGGKPRIVNYDAKWNKKSIDYRFTKRSCPAEIDEKLAAKLVQLAFKSAEAMLCSDYLRVDFRVGKKNVPYVLEVNPNPDISEDAGLAAMAAAKGYSYRHLISRIVESALQRK